MLRAFRALRPVPSFRRRLAVGAAATLSLVCFLFRLRGSHCGRKQAGTSLFAFMAAPEVAELGEDGIDYRSADEVVRMRAIVLQPRFLVFLRPGIARFADRASGDVVHHFPLPRVHASILRNETTQTHGFASHDP